MPWHQLTSAQDPELDRLAALYHLHPLHLEDCRTEGERVKSDVLARYTFTLLRTYQVPPGRDLDVEPEQHAICIFAGHDFLITIADRTQSAVAGALARADAAANDARREAASGAEAGSESSTGAGAPLGTRVEAEPGNRAEDTSDVACEVAPGRLLYLIFDAVVDAYFPALDPLDDRIDELEDRVLSPTPELLESIFSVKRTLVDFRRLLVSTRDAAMHLQRDPGSIIDAEHQLYLRDLYDHVARLLDSVESERDLLNNALDIYLSSVANRTNEVMKVLTVLSTVALPALVMTGIYGMNIRGLPFTENPHGGLIVGAMTVTFTAGLLVAARRLDWI